MPHCPMNDIWISFDAMDAPKSVEKDLGHPRQKIAIRDWAVDPGAPGKGYFGQQALIKGKDIDCPPALLPAAAV